METRVAFTFRDPLGKPKFGGAERELEAVAAYSRTIEDLDAVMQKAREPENDEHAPTDLPGAPKGGGRGRGRGRPGNAPAPP